MTHLLACFLGVALLVVAGTAEAQTPPAAADTLAAPADTLAKPAAIVAPAATAAPKAAAPATAAPTAATPPPQAAPSSSEPSRVYYGGSVGFSFWNDYFRISVEPLVGYKLTPKLSTGLKFRYEYLNDDSGAIDYDSHNFGGSVFSRYRLLPVVYAHAEYAVMSYDYPIERQVVPFLLLGGGVSKPMGRNAWLTAEVLVDVLQDDNSPYEDWEPILSVGIGVGF